MDNDSTQEAPDRPKLLAKSWCVSKSKILQFSHVWTIDNIGFYLDSSSEECLEEETTFVCNEKFTLQYDYDRSISWSLNLLLRSPNMPNSILMKLKPVPSKANKDKVIKVRFSFFIIDKNAKKLYIKGK